jgi:hypothetical protein
MENDELKHEEFLSESSARIFLNPLFDIHLWKEDYTWEDQHLPNLGFCYGVLAFTEEKMKEMLEIVDTLKMYILDRGKTKRGKRTVWVFYFYPYADMKEHPNVTL